MVMIVELTDVIANVIRVAVIFCGAILAGSLFAMAWHHRKLTAQLGGQAAPPFSVILPWWAVSSWALFVVAGVLPHVSRFGHERLWTLPAILNVLATIVGAVALWRARQVEKEKLVVSS